VLDFNLRPLIKKIYFDVQVYEGIFFHIISNAVKFTSRGSKITIKVSLVPFYSQENQSLDEIMIETVKQSEGDSDIMGMLITQIVD
jgi:signal transduction histidine kinase